MVSAIGSRRWQNYIMCHQTANSLAILITWQATEMNITIYLTVVNLKQTTSSYECVMVIVIVHFHLVHRRVQATNHPVSLTINCSTNASGKRVSNCMSAAWQRRNMSINMGFLKAAVYTYNYWPFNSSKWITAAIHGMSLWRRFHKTVVEVVIT